jgi:CubicO group peptidase (beta-lactamase class C family)
MGQVGFDAFFEERIFKPLGMVVELAKLDLIERREGPHDNRLHFRLSRILATTDRRAGQYPGWPVIS